MLLSRGLGVLSMYATTNRVRLLLATHRAQRGAAYPTAPLPIRAITNRSC